MCADYDNSIDVTFTVTAKIFGNSAASVGEQTAVKALLIQQVEQINILHGGSGISVKVTDCSEAE